MCVIDYDECNCDCHKYDGVMHFVPCCDICHVCKKNIKYRYESHVKECKQRYRAIQVACDNYQKNRALL